MIRAQRISGHMGEFLQGCLGPQGTVALITLPAPALHVAAEYRPGPLSLWQPKGMVITPACFRALLRALRHPPQGRWILRAKLPVGHGAGASTAAILALARLMAPRISDPDLEALCLSLEGASDPLLHPRPERLLWASRQGRRLAELPPLPPLQIVGGFSGPARRTDAGDTRFPDITDLLEAWPPACHDVALLAPLVTEGARRRMAMLGQDPRPLQHLAQSYGALGFGIAHTGSARFFILPRLANPAPLYAHLRGLGWQHLQHLTF